MRPKTRKKTDAGRFNNSVAEQQAVLETVARVKPKKNETKDKEKSFHIHDVFNLDNENRADETPALIDSKDNVFILSSTKSKYPVLQLDLRLISDLVVVIVSAICGGIAFACGGGGQPVFTGYLLAGSLIGPGRFSFVSEMVQVEAVAQFGVIFLLFALGLEFSAAKLRVVRAVAVLGGLLQIFLFICLCGFTASVETVAQFGVIFLLFALDLEFSAAKLRVVRAVAVCLEAYSKFSYLYAYVVLQLR